MLTKVFKILLSGMVFNYLCSFARSKNIRYLSDLQNK